MSDNLTIFGNTYNNVTSITLTDTNNQQQKYVNTADTNATAADILSGKTAYIQGSKVTGNMAFKPAEVFTPGTLDQIISAGQYLSGAQTIKGDVNLIAENIASGVSIFGVQGTHSGGDTSGADGIIDKTISGAYVNSRVTSIGGYAFAYCNSLATVSFPVCTSIDRHAFASCSNLTTISFPTCTSIGNYAFDSCSNLTTASFPVCTRIGSYAFYDCTNLTTASFPACTSISSYAFANCYSLTTISFPVCTRINGATFSYCYNLTTANFPACTNIGGYAFLYCYNLTTANFPACTSIGGYAFSQCYRLLSMYLLGSSFVSLTASTTFSSTPIAGYTTSTGGVYGSIYVPASMLESYKTMTNWVYFSDRFVAYDE